MWTAIRKAGVWLIASGCVVLPLVNAVEADGPSEPSGAAAPAPEHIPDLREERLAVKLQERNWFIVPVPVSNPTVGSGLVLGGAYFYPQTEAEKKVQPASVTGAAGFYSSNDSAAFGIAHQSYWDSNKWRLGGAMGHVDLNLDLTAPGAGASQSVDWAVEGEFFAALISRKLAGKWYAGVLGRYLDVRQAFDVDLPSAQFNTAEETVSAGLGFKLERDARDKPINSYSGNIFEFSVLGNADTFGSDDAYVSYSARYRSYHSLPKSVVLAWEFSGCYRSGEAPLWDACRIGLRGFSATDYLGRSSASAQVEARWQFHPKWGGVAFAGGGSYGRSFSEQRENDFIPSYGVGLRYLVLKSQRINMRLDYARSTDSDAIYLSVAEAF